MSVLRKTYLPIRPPTGRLLVAESVAWRTRTALQGFWGPDGPHEGLVFWLGRRISTDTVVLAAVVPDCEHDPQRVMASAGEIGRIARQARRSGLGIVAQVHTHGGTDTRHSDGDDILVLMPFEGMFSLVVGQYGQGGITPPSGLGLHQFQHGRWVLIDPACEDAMIVVPALEATL